MSYAAEPYLHITDQLLTGLTGGVARQSFRFLPQANPFALEVERGDIVPETVAVIGQAQEAFHAFQQGKDYAIATNGTLRFLADGADANAPAKNATWPDEGSEFFVRFYHTESGQALLTDRNVGSLVRTLAEAFAREIAVLSNQLQAIYRSAFLDTAEGAALDLVVDLVGLTRKTRDYATGTVRFYRDTPAPGDIFIPEGTRVSTRLNPAAAFATTAAKTLRRGQLAVEAPVRSEEKGAKGLTPERTITVINQPILGLTGAVNDPPTVIGAAAESDAELRARARRVIERVGKATPRAIVHALTTEAGLNENELKIVEDLTNRPGVVEVFVARDPSADLAQKVENAILGSRAAGIRVEHNLAVALPVVVKDSLPEEAARDEGVTEGAPAPGDFRLPLRAELTIYPENPRIAGADKAILQAGVTAAVRGAVEASSVGGTLIYNQIVADLMAVAGVLDVVLVLEPKDGAAGAGKRNIQLPEGRRAVLGEEDLSVAFAGAPMSFDLVFAVTLKGGNTAEDAAKELKPKLNTLFAAGFSTLSAAALVAAMGSGTTYLFDAAGVTWTAEHDQAGLILRDQGGASTPTTVPTGDRPVLRNVKVAQKP